MKAGLLLAAVITVGLFARALYPADLPSTANPDFLDNVFDNRTVLLASRLLLVSAAAILALGGIFIAVSIGHRMKNGEWLRRAGPFEISERKAAQAESEIDYWQRELEASKRRITALRQELEHVRRVVADLRDLG